MAPNGDKVLDFRKTELGRMYSLAHTVHDELIYVVKDEHADVFLQELLGVMQISPEWWPELVLGAEGGIAQNYGAAK